MLSMFLFGRRYNNSQSWPSMNTKHDLFGRYHNNGLLWPSMNAKHDLLEDIITVSCGPSMNAKHDLFG
jgi:hypothetical protein